MPTKPQLYRFRNRHLHDSGGGWEKDWRTACKNLQQQSEKDGSKVWLLGGDTPKDFRAVIWQVSRVSQDKLFSFQEKNMLYHCAELCTCPRFDT